MDNFLVFSLELTLSFFVALLGYGAWRWIQSRVALQEADFMSRVSRMKDEELERFNRDMIKLREHLAHAQSQISELEKTLREYRRLLIENGIDVPEVKHLPPPEPISISEFIFSAFSREHVETELLPKLRMSYKVDWASSDFKSASMGSLVEEIEERARMEGVTDLLIEALVELRPFREHELGRM